MIYLPRCLFVLQGIKRLEVTTSITDHHLHIKTKSLVKWLSGNKQVYVNISGKETGRVSYPSQIFSSSLHSLLFPM